MPRRFEPKTAILPPAQREIWPQFAPARPLSFVLYGGTERGLAACAQMFKIDPALPLRALGFFQDGDLPSLPKADQDILRAARDRVTNIPDLALKPGLISPS